MTDELLAAARGLTSIPGARGALIVDAEAGVPVASDLADGIPETALAALTGALFRGIVDATATTGQGRPRLLQLEAEGGHLIVAGAGRLTSDDQLRVDSVALSREMNPQGSMEERLNVFVSVILACQRFEIAGYPLEIVRLRRYDGPIRFHDRRRQADGCPPGVEERQRFQ